MTFPTTSPSGLAAADARNLLASRGATAGIPNPGLAHDDYVAYVLSELLINLPANIEGAGIAPSYLGYNTIGGTTDAIAANIQTTQKITVASTGIIASVGAYLKVTAQFFINPYVALFADSSGTRGEFLGGAAMASVNLADNALGWRSAPLNIRVTAADYWIGIVANQAMTLYYDATGTSNQVNVGAGSFKAQSLDAGTALDRKYSLRALFLPST